MDSRRIALLFGILLLLGTSLPAWAGGWAEVKVDSLPSEIRAGSEIVIGFTVLQHGVTPVNDATPTLIAHQPSTGESLNIVGIPTGEGGHYLATLTFPSAGQWEWEIIPLPFGGRVEMEGLTVLPPLAQAATGAAPALPVGLLVGGALLLLVIGLAYQQRRQWAKELPV